jgi:hypothetical protein
MSLETQFRRSLFSIALVAGMVGLIVSQSEATVPGAEAASMMAACEVQPAEATGGSSSDEASQVTRTSWRTLLPSVFVRTRNN